MSDLAADRKIYEASKSPLEFLDSWEEKAFLEAYKSHFETLQSALAYVKVNLEKEKLNVRKCALSAQAVATTQAIDTAVGTEYFFVNKDFQKAKTIVADINKDIANLNWDHFTKRDFGTGDSNVKRRCSTC